MKGSGGSTTRRKRPWLVSGNQNSPGPICTTRPLPSVIGWPLIMLEGHEVTPSSANTVAGAPVSTLTRVTRAPETGAPVSLSKTTPKGSTSTRTSAEMRIASSPGRIAAMVMRVSAPTLRRQSSCTSGGGMRRVSITPAKTPLSAVVSNTVMVSRSPSGVESTTVRLSITVGSRLAEAAVISKNSGSPPRSSSVCWTLATEVGAVEVASPPGVRLAVAVARSSATETAPALHCGARKTSSAPPSPGARR